MIISYWYVKSESGDEYDGSCVVLAKDEEAVKKHIVDSLWFEVEEYANEGGLSQDYCLENPEEALNCALLYPTIRFITEEI